MTVVFGRRDGTRGGASTSVRRPVLLGDAVQCRVEVRRQRVHADLVAVGDGHRVSGMCLDGGAEVVHSPVRESRDGARSRWNRWVVLAARSSSCEPVSTGSRVADRRTVRARAMRTAADARDRCCEIAEILGAHRGHSRSTGPDRPAVHTSPRLNARREIGPLMSRHTTPMVALPEHAARRYAGTDCRPGALRGINRIDRQISGDPGESPRERFSLRGSDVVLGGDSTTGW